ncbi:MAG: hypothetical protein QHC67_14305 [Sphingobium sp.]|uniref:hypothetical protein n=1 Tax=Sphingobium sp. TaxID=1912891 RepID=UPI0029A82C01|nr:hypothetical protein [Sphingobium sp.]MDX3910972.1 hypothetical protein [Sphingobium sp.]
MPKCAMSARGGVTGELSVKTFVKVLGLASLVTLAACDSAQENKVENAYENQADALENQADKMEDKADNLTGNAAASAENVSDALEEKADATREAGDAAADKVEDKVDNAN